MQTAFVVFDFRSNKCALNDANLILLQGDAKTDSDWMKAREGETYESYDVGTSYLGFV